MLPVVLGALALIVFAALTRLAARRCYRIDRNAHRRAQTEWAEYRRASTAVRR